MRSEGRGRGPAGGVLRENVYHVASESRLPRFPLFRLALYQDLAVTASPLLRSATRGSLRGLCGQVFRSHRRNSHTSRHDSPAGAGGRTQVRPFLGDSYQSNHGRSLRFLFRLLLRIRMCGRLSLMVCCHCIGRNAVNKYISHSASGTSNTKQAALIAILVLTSEESITWWPHSLSLPDKSCR